MPKPEPEQPKRLNRRPRRWRPAEITPELSKSRRCPRPSKRRSRGGSSKACREKDTRPVEKPEQRRPNRSVARRRKGRAETCGRVVRQEDRCEVEQQGASASVRGRKIQPNADLRRNPYPAAARASRNRGVVVVPTRFAVGAGNGRVVCQRSLWPASSTGGVTVRRPVRRAFRPSAVAARAHTTIRSSCARLLQAAFQKRWVHVWQLAHLVSGFDGRFQAIASKKHLARRRRSRYRRPRTSSAYR